MSLLRSLGRSPTFFSGIKPFYSIALTEESGERGGRVFTRILRLADKLAREVTMITVMNLECQCWFVLISALSLGSTAVAHPSSGIAVTELGEVFFVHTTRGVAKLDHAGKLTYIHTNSGGHWLCLDRHGSFSRTQPKHFLRITADGVRPGIIFADGGAPIAVCEDSNLYY